MRAFAIGLTSLLAVSGSAFAQTKAAPKPATPVNEVRYFTAIDGFMDGNADVILKEARQGKAVTSAVLDVCYPVDKTSDRRDRFVANLTVNGQTLTGSTQSLGDKAPVTVKLIRKPTGETFEFKGSVSIGQAVSEIASTENSDLSEKEFQDNQSTDDSIAAAPKDFTEVSPEAVGIRVKLEAAVDFLKSLKGQNVEVALASLTVSCDALRAGEQIINLTVDPDRAAGLIAKAKATPGVVAAGWTSGTIDMDRAIRFAAADWRDGERLNRDKLGSAITAVLAKSLGGKLASSKWSDDTGKLKLTFKRPSAVLPALDLTESVEFTVLAGPDRPGTTDKMMLWLSSPSSTTADETAGPRLNLIDTASSDEEGAPKDDSGALDALAREFKAQRWDSDKSAWK